MRESDQKTVDAYWGREDLESAIVNSLTEMGKNLDALTIHELAPFDHFHAGGKASTGSLAKLAGLVPGLNVLDVGGGLGGPARTLAVEFGCSVTVVDLTESYLKTGEALTSRLRLEGQVRHRLGDALNLPFDDQSFDVVWTQNACMNIRDKERLYAGFRRVLRPGGLLVFQEPMAGPVQPMFFPVMWADDASSSFLLSPTQTQSLIEATGFQLRHWVDVTREFARRNPPAAHSIQHLIMGERSKTLAVNSQRSEAEGRLVNVQGVFERTSG
jgi:SAM-dependent methyltransferase